MVNEQTGGVPEVEGIEAKCGHCMFWRPIQMKIVEVGTPQRGMCWGVPATPIPTYSQRGDMIGQKDIRPCPMEHEMCGLFAPKPGLEMGGGGAHN